MESYVNKTSSFRVTLETTNGKAIKVSGVNRVRVHDGLLSLSSMNKRNLTPEQIVTYGDLVDPDVLWEDIHIGSWPLVNLAMYRIHNEFLP